MRAQLKDYLRRLRSGLLWIVQHNPVEVLLTTCGCVGCMLAYEFYGDALLAKLTLVPIFAVLAFVVNHLVGRGPWRWVYWICWLPLVPLLLLWSGHETWVGSLSFRLTFVALLPMAMLMCRRAVQNDRFISDLLTWLRSGALALLFANVALALFCAILYSTTYIFGLQGGWIEHTAIYAVILAETIFVPMLLLAMVEQRLGTAVSGSRFVEVLLNYMVTPALLIYTLVLYLYGAKIVLTWSLPQGGVAYLVFGFTLFAIGVRALQFLLHKRLYDWFFDRFSLISLPLQVLFWIGVVHRTSEYGLTTMRVLLVVCGALMTLGVVLFLSQRTGRYLILCLAGFVSFAAVAYIPVLQPEELAVRSQVRRAIGAAERLQLLAADGTLHLESLATDTLRREDYQRLHESLTYLARHDSAAFARFGVDRKTLDGALADQASQEDAPFWISRAQRSCMTRVAGYNTLYTNLAGWSGAEGAHYRIDGDTLRIDFAGTHVPYVRSANALLHTQLRKIGAGPNPRNATLRAATEELLTYTDDEVLILFSALQFDRCDSLLRLTDVSIDGVMTR